MIEVVNLTKVFNGIPVVDNLSFSIKRGEVLGFLGPNGAGKTTTMKMITGYWPADSGLISVDGKNISEDLCSAQRRIGYLPENNPLYEDMKVFEYLKYVAEIRDIIPDKQLDRIKQVVERCGLNKVIGQQIGQLSKGFRQRVGLAGAIMHKPDLLILDEPTNGLDPNQILEIRELIREIGREQTVILSTHILSEAEAICDRLIIINHGQLVAEGRIEDLTGLASNNWHWTVEAESNAVKEALTACPEITRAEEINNSWVISPATPEIQRFLAELATKNNWPVLGFHLERAGLEEVFQKLTC